MGSQDKFPATLQEAVIHFAQFENCKAFMVSLRWPDGKVLCPQCGSDDVDYLPNARVFKCYQKHPRQKFSLKVGTVFEDSPIPLEKWLPVMWMLVNAKNGISSWEVHRALGVTQKTAWFMLQRCRLALQNEGHGGKLGGQGQEVEVDETFIGGKARYMHKDRKRRAMGWKAGGVVGKTAVQGILERGGKVRAHVPESAKRKPLVAGVKDNVEPGSTVYTDEAATYYEMLGDYDHQVINHLESYVNVNVHTNGIENFWSLLKRGLGGTYVSVEPFHLFRYVDEQAFRFNNRGPMNDAQRFTYAMRKIVGKRLTYAQLTGKTLEAGPSQEEPF
jgi:transposase-like protein